MNQELSAFIARSVYLGFILTFKATLTDISNLKSENCS